MKKLFAILFFVALSWNLSAQVDYSFGNIKHKRDRGVVPIIGIKGGLTHYYMSFAYDEFNKQADDFELKPGFGLYVEYPVKKVRGLAISGEVMMIERGFKKSFDFRGDMPVVYQIKANYLDIRIPIIYYFRPTEQLNPYVFLTPDFGLCYGGSMSKTYPNNPEYNKSVDVSKTDAMNPYDISLNLGAGVRYNIHFQVFTLVLKLDGSFNLGFLNTNAAEETTYVDNIAYHVSDESRHNRGFELMFSIGLPLKFNRLHDSCWGWK